MERYGIILTSIGVMSIVLPFFGFQHKLILAMGNTPMSSFIVTVVGVALIYFAGNAQAERQPVAVEEDSIARRAS